MRETTKVDYTLRIDVEQYNSLLLLCGKHGYKDLVSLVSDALALYTGLLENDCISPNGTVRVQDNNGFYINATNKDFKK